MKSFAKISYIYQEKLPSWTSRGQGKCSQCGVSYSTAWKPKTCKNCNYEIGGSYIPKDKKRKTASPDGAIIVASTKDGVNIFSVKANYRENRVLVVADGNTSVCHHEKCKSARSVHMASSEPSQFTCQHIKLSQAASNPVYQTKLTNEMIQSYPADSTTKTSLQSIQAPDNFFPIVQISPYCYVVYTSPNASSPTGYTHVFQDLDKSWRCSSKSCNKKSGSTKQLKVKPLCLHQHVLLCYLNVTPAVIIQQPSETANELDETISTSRLSTIKLNSRRSIPYPFPASILQRCQSMSQWPTTFSPPDTVCNLCNSSLSGPRLHPGQNTRDVCYIITSSCLFQTVEIRVKVCSNSKCKAMFQVWPIEQGMSTSLFMFRNYSLAKLISQIIYTACAMQLARNRYIMNAYIE